MKQAILEQGGRTVEIKVGDKFLMEVAETPFRTSSSEKVECKLARSSKVQAEVTWLVYFSTCRDITGRLVIKSPEDAYKEIQHFTPYAADTGWGYKVIDENTFEHYSDNRVVYRATRIN